MFTIFSESSGLHLAIKFLLIILLTKTFLCQRNNKWIAIRLYPSKSKLMYQMNAVTHEFLVPIR